LELTTSPSPLPTPNFSRLPLQKFVETRTFIPLPPLPPSIPTISCPSPNPLLPNFGGNNVSLCSSTGDSLLEPRTSSPPNSADLVDLDGAFPPNSLRGLLRLSLRRSALLNLSVGVFEECQTCGVEETAEIGDVGDDRGFAG